MINLSLLNNFYPVIYRGVIAHGSVTRYGPQSVASATWFPFLSAAIWTQVDWQLTNWLLGQLTCKISPIMSCSSMEITETPLYYILLELVESAAPSGAELPRLSLWQQLTRVCPKARTISTSARVLRLERPMCARTYVEEPDILSRRPPAFSMLLSSFSCSRASPRFSFVSSFFLLFLFFLPSLTAGHDSMTVTWQRRAAFFNDNQVRPRVTSYFSDGTDGLWWHPAGPACITFSFSASTLRNNVLLRYSRQKRTLVASFFFWRLITFWKHFCVRFGFRGVAYMYVYLNDDCEIQDIQEQLSVSSSNCKFLKYFFYISSTFLFVLCILLLLLILLER